MERAYRLLDKAGFETYARSSSKQKNSVTNFREEMWGPRVLIYYELVRMFVQKHPTKIAKILELARMQKGKGSIPPLMSIDNAFSALDHYIPSDDDE